MRRWYYTAVLLTLLSVGSSPVDAQRVVARPAKTVLFVCEHGTVKSLLAKVLFEQYAEEVGLRMDVVSRGTHADSVVPPWMQQGLSADHVTLGSWRPQTLRATDLANASLVVSFDVPAASTAATRAPRACWNNLPSVSRDYSAGRDAIKVRVHQLVDSLKSANGTGRP